MVALLGDVVMLVGGIVLVAASVLRFVDRKKNSQS